jgi:hypothetical protein
MRVRRLFSYAVLLAVLIGDLTVVVITIDRGAAWWPTTSEGDKPWPCETTSAFRSRSCSWLGTPWLSPAKRDRVVPCLDLEDETG